MLTFGSWFDRMLFSDFHIKSGATMFVDELKKLQGKRVKIKDFREYEGEVVAVKRDYLILQNRQKRHYSKAHGRWIEGDYLYCDLIFIKFSKIREFVLLDFEEDSPKGIDRRAASIVETALANFFLQLKATDPNVSVIESDYVVFEGKRFVLKDDIFSFNVELKKESYPDPMGHWRQ